MSNTKKLYPFKNKYTGYRKEKPMSNLQKMIMALDEERMRTDFGSPLYNTLTNVINELIDARDANQNSKIIDESEQLELFKFNH